MKESNDGDQGGDGPTLESPRDEAWEKMNLLTLGKGFLLSESLALH